MTIHIDYSRLNIRPATIFADLAVGDTFIRGLHQREDKPPIYMRMPTHAGTLSAVSLSSGMSKHVASNEQVFPVDVILTPVHPGETLTQAQRDADHRLDAFSYAVYGATVHQAIEAMRPTHIDGYVFDHNGRRRTFEVESNEVVIVDGAAYLKLDNHDVTTFGQYVVLNAGDKMRVVAPHAPSGERVLNIRACNSGVMTISGASSVGGPRKTGDEYDIVRNQEHIEGLRNYREEIPAPEFAIDAFYDINSAEEIVRIEREGMRVTKVVVSLDPDSYPVELKQGDHTMTVYKITP